MQLGWPRPCHCLANSAWGSEQLGATMHARPAPHQFFFDYSCSASRQASRYERRTQALFSSELRDSIDRRSLVQHRARWRWRGYDEYLKSKARGYGEYGCYNNRWGYIGVDSEPRCWQEPRRECSPLYQMVRHAWSEMDDHCADC